MWFGKIIWRNLHERLTRSMLTVVGLGIAVAAIATLWHTAWGYARSASNYYADRGVDIVVVRAGVSNRLTSRLNAQLSAPLASIPGIAWVEGVLTEMVSLGETQLIGIPLRGYAPHNKALGWIQISEGRTLASADRNAVLIGNALAKSLDKRVGETIEIEGTPFRIAGIFLAENPFDANCLVAPLADVQTLMERPGAVSEFQIGVVPSVNNDAELNEICRSIEALADSNKLVLGLKAQRTHRFIESASEARLGGAMARGTTLLVSVLSLMAMLNTMLMSVVERTKEIGILRAIGWRKARIVHLILGESVVLCLAGAILGTFLAWLLVQGLSHWQRTSLFVPSGLSWAALCFGAVATFGTGVVGAIYPALYAASMPPVASLRHE